MSVFDYIFCAIIAGMIVAIVCLIAECISLNRKINDLLK